MRTATYRISRAAFRGANRALNRFGVLLSKPEIIHGSPAFSGAITWSRRLHGMKYYFDLIDGIEGEIVESGVHWGYGLLIEIFLSLDKPRKIFAFDSFSGHSNPTDKDQSGGSYQPLDASFKISEDDVWKTLVLGTGLRQDDLSRKVEMIPGWMQATMPRFRERTVREKISIAFVHADSDIYEPIKATLEGTWHALSVGGIIAVGLMNNPELMGKTTAVKEFLATLPEDTYELRTRDGGSDSYILKLR